MPSLNGQQIIDKANNLIDDEFEAGDDFALDEANEAKDEIEAELKLYICQALDETNSTSNGQTYATAISMPSKFLNFAKPYIYVGGVKFFGVPLQDKAKWKDAAYRFWYDPSDGIHLSGIQNASQLISIPYIKSTPDLTLSTSPIWPSQFHKLIPMKMAIEFFPIDQGDKAQSWEPEWLGLYQRLLDRFADWDAKMKLSLQGGRSGYQDDYNTGIPLGQM